ncbi:unnamed protein product [Rotaria sp. Silwood2]|nr:unnamed protein product [Rotaria sp. Silwood2]
MASENIDEINLKDCLQLFIVAVSDAINSLEQQQTQSNEKEILNNLEIQIKNLLDEKLSLLSFQCQNYLFNICKQYNYNIQEKKFSIILTKEILFSFIHNLKCRLFLLDACQAAWNGNKIIVKNFIENYSILKDKSGLYGTTLLYSAARNNHFNIVKYLIEIGKCLVNIKNEDYNEINQEITFKASTGSTPLHAACYNGHLQIVKYLIEHGADYFILNNFHETPIQNGQLKVDIQKFFKTFLLSNYSKRSNNLPNKTILDDLEKNKDIIDCIWEYKSLLHDQWLPVPTDLSNQLQQSLIINSDKKFQTEIDLKTSKDIYYVSFAQFLCSIINNNEADNIMWLRCRGSSLLNFHCYSQWQIMFIKYPTSIAKLSVSIQIFNMTTTNTIQLNSWYNANTKINFLFERAINYRRKYIIINLDFINNEQIIFDLENFTFTNQQNTIKGFLRWIPKIIINNNHKLIIVDNFQLSANSDLILLTTSYLKQAQHNGIISIDEINQYELKYENDFHDEILDFSNEVRI